jgi:hypothetical protein
MRARRVDGEGGLRHPRLNRELWSEGFHRGHRGFPALPAVLSPLWSLCLLGSIGCPLRRTACQRLANIRMGNSKLSGNA